MSAVRYTILIEQGSTLRFPIGVTNPDTNTPWDLTGCTARMQIRPSIASPEIIHSLTTGWLDVRSIGYAELIPNLIKAIQELTAKVEALENS